MFGGFAPLPLRLTSHEDGVNAPQFNALARDTFALQTCNLAVLRFTAGTAGSLIGYTTAPGIAVENQPLITTSGTGVGTVRFESSYLDRFGERFLVAIDAADVQAGGLTAAAATATIDDATTVTVRRFNLSAVATSGEVTLVLKGRAPAGEWHRVGHYGAALDKSNTNYERLPYAYGYFRMLQQGRGSGYRAAGTYAQAEDLATARAYAMVTRAGEAVNANALARTAWSDLPRYVRDFGMVERPSESRQELRQRAAAFEEAPHANDRATIDQALSDLLGPLFVRTWWYDQSASLTSEPTPTFWIGGTNGPNTYTLGSAPWLSARANLVVEVAYPQGIDLRRYLELLNVDMFRLLTARLPATMTFNWATGISADDGSIGDGFNLDLDDMDFEGMT